MFALNKCQTDNPQIVDYFCGICHRNNIENVLPSLFIKSFWSETPKLICNMIEITCNDRLGKKVRVKCNPDDTIGDLKKLIAAQIGTNSEKIILKKWYRIFNDNVSLADCKFTLLLICWNSLDF